MARWTHHGFNIQHLSALYGQVYLDLYTGQKERAWQRIPGMWSACRKSFLLRIQQVRIDVLQLSGRSALAAAWGADPEPLLHVAAGYACRLEREGLPWSLALARLIQAGVAARRGDQERAARLFAKAAAGFDAVPMGMFAAAARRRQGELLGGAEGGALIDTANAWMKGQQIQDVARMTAAFAPPVLQ